MRLRGAAPAFSLPSLRTGAPLGLGSFRGRPLLMELWSPTCGPCRAEAPVLARAYAHGSGGVAFLGVETGGSRAAGLALARRDRVGYPLAFDPSEKVASRYRAVGLPTTILISSGGRLVGRQLGVLSAAQVRSDVAMLLHSEGRRPGSAR